jgi:hypothetical protein
LETQAIVEETRVEALKRCENEMVTTLTCLSHAMTVTLIDSWYLFMKLSTMEMIFSTNLNELTSCGIFSEVRRIESIRAAVEHITTILLFSVVDTDTVLWLRLLTLARPRALYY